MMASTTNSSIKHPKPNNGQSSNGLLSPHMSVLEALQSTANEDENKSPQYSPQFNNFANHQNTPTFNDFEFTSNTSWHSVGDYLAPRPTSSVLSSSDTEEDTQDHAPLAIKPRQSITSESDEKTIEINMNSGIKDPGSSDGSSFVLPQMFSQINDSNYVDQNSKILIIGHKKVQFLHTLDYQLQKRFTLNNHDNYNIILVIFDGLIKIGNILNFIKYNGTQLRNKLFIPIFRNINLKIIDKILRNYNINLLCSPINLDNKYEVNNLLNVLKEDYLLKDSKTVADSIIPLQDNQVAIEQTMNSYQLIRISSSDSDESCEKDGTTNNSLVLQNYHQDRIQKKYFLLGISLSVGIGIGITTALTISFLKSKKAVPPPPAPHLNHYKKFTTLTIDQLSKSNDLLKRNLIHFKQHVGDLSKIVYDHSKDYVVKVTHLWDQFVVSASQGVQAGAMLWFF
ncbi:unnamed protein product [Wickerhamomyces anomalus]